MLKLNVSFETTHPCTVVLAGMVDLHVSCVVEEADLLVVLRSMLKVEVSCEEADLLEVLKRMLKL
jgi:hypothetical protein